MGKMGLVGGRGGTEAMSLGVKWSGGGGGGIVIERHWGGDR